MQLAVFVAHAPMAFATAAEPTRQMAARLEAQLPPESAAAARTRAQGWTLDDAAADAMTWLEQWGPTG